MSDASWYVNGAWVRPSAARVSVTDAGLETGDGLFETLLVYRGRPLEAPRHVDRLLAGARRLELSIPESAQELLQVIGRVAAATPGAWSRLRVTLTRGDGREPTRVVCAHSYVPPGPELLEAGAVAWLCERPALLSSDPLAGLKSTSYQRHLRAAREAAAHGAWEALLTNEDGELVEGSRTNLFVRTAAGWLTPPTTAGCLPGIVRALVLEAGWAREARVDRPLLATARAAALTNSLVGWLPLRRIGEQRLTVDEEVRALRRRLAALRGVPDVALRAPEGAT